MDLRAVIREHLESQVDHVEEFNDDLFVEVAGKGYVVKVREWHPGFLTPAALERALE